MKTAIIFPAFNEEITIKDVIESFHEQLPSAGIFVVDNNSTDSTANIARKTVSGLRCKGAVLFEGKQGKANAVRKAFTEIDADYYVIADADMTYPAESVHELLKPLVDRIADMVVGDRHKTGGYKRENKRTFHNFGNTFVRRLINLLFGSKLNDIFSGFRAFNKKFVKNFPVLSAGFEIETELTLHALDKGFSVLEIPINYRDRPAGSHSKLNTYRDGIRVVKLIIDIFKNYRPMTFFGIISGLFLFSGLLSGSPVIIEYYYTGIVLHVPLAILATGLMVLSMLSFAIGIILNTIDHKHRFLYELRLVKYMNNRKRNDSFIENTPFKDHEFRTEDLSKKKQG